MTTDEGIHAKISELVAQEKALRAQLQDGEIEPGEEHQQLHALEVQLDQCWDLLRQRQALREVGDDPDAASVRPASEVENYRQ
jgi:uncharacterized protein involved in exopolysaccharide biosynthesis